MMGIVICATGTFSSNAQVVGVTLDSVNILKQERKDLEIRKRLNENKLKLAKLQNTLQEKRDAVSSKSKDAQDAAAQNQETAEKLNNDPQNRKLAKKSRKDAKNAQSAANAGRNATEHLQDLEKDIANLQKEIAEDEARLGLAPSGMPQ